MRADGDREALRLLMIDRDNAVASAKTARTALAAILVTAPAPLRESTCSETCAGDGSDVFQVGVIFRQSVSAGRHRSGVVADSRWSARLIFAGSMAIHAGSALWVNRMARPHRVTA
jgi:hypothetical protein